MDGLKKISIGNLIVSIVLIAAVVVLYIFHFNNNSQTEKVAKQKPVELQQPAGNSSVNIAFVDSDLLLEKYVLVEKLARQMDKETRSKDADFSARQKEFEAEAAYFQESMAKNSLNEQRAQGIYEQLMVKQQELYQLQEQYSAELAQKEFQMNVTLLDSVRNYLERMNAGNKYDYILNYNASGSILQANNTFDITELVLQGLNAEYNEKYAPKD